MPEITRILSQIEQGDSAAADDLLSLVYDELRRLAAAKLADEKPGQTLQATALVHEAFIRLVDVEKTQTWNSRGHFFAAAAEAMRRILIEAARRKKREKRGGSWQRVELHDVQASSELSVEELMLLSDAIDTLISKDSAAGNLAKLHCFAGLSVEDAGRAIGLSRSNAYRQWTYAKAWLFGQFGEDNFGPPSEK